ncbi:MAG: AAA family ATPase [Deltaproteobacteria bacterium]|nr:AAA family ATPase [Deltaproteobacteria bacterium]
MAMTSPEDRMKEFRHTFAALEEEVGRVIVGHHDAVRKVLTAFFAGGHVLIEGVPGLGKTLMVKSLSQALGLSFKRIQFTPDLMPSDIVGTQVLADGSGARHFEFKQGPIFANIVLADEINRATPKTQSALLEAMEEHQVSVFGETHSLDSPFFVLATQNPIEIEGTYPLPEAQLDRFLMKLIVHPPTSVELTEILTRTTTSTRYEIKQILPTDRAHTLVEEMKALVREVLLAPPLANYVARLIAAATPGADQPVVPEVTQYFRFGPGPRGAQAITLGAKVNALLDGRVNVSFEDLADITLPALRHRCLLNFQAEAENITADQIVAMILKKVAKK